MKTRCRGYARRQRMTASDVAPSKQDNTVKETEKSGDLTEGAAGKDLQVLHETRSQKQASKKRLHEDHAETTKDSSFSVASEAANISVGVATRSSTRPSKRPKLSTPVNNRLGNQENSTGGETVATTSSPPQTNRRKKQVKRQWESWGKAEKDTFFEALHEYGKDFDKICNFIATKHKRRGDPPALIKNKDQVRHFYYRSLNKITKYLPELSGSDNQTKMIIELKGLICYGELRKKICGWNDKHGKKLEELLSHGTISIRSKGRNFKIKAPMQCRALKRLTSTGQGKEDSDTQPLAMPNKLVLELSPHDHSAWAAVQKLSKNPRLRTSVPPKKPLSLMLHFLTKKWHIVSLKTLKPLDLFVAIPPEFHMNSDVVEKHAGSPACKTPSSDHGCADNAATPDALPLEDMAKTCSPSSLDEGNASVNNVFGINGILQHAAQEIAENGCSGDKTASSEAMGGAGADNLSQTDKSAEAVSTEETQTCTETKPDSCSTSEPAMQDEKGDCNDKNHSSFWTLDTCGNITFGEIFCKLGRPPKLKLEYTWDDIENNLAPSQTAVSLTKLVNIASAEFVKVKGGSNESKTTSKSSDVSQTKNCSNSATKDKGASSNVSKEKAGSKSARPTTKTSEKLPFILPSVVPPATQTSTTRTVFSDLSPSIRPMARIRKRQQRPNVHRTLLPRPVGSPSSVPPGAVAVSFIPQPGQTVGTILASGVSTSTATSSTQSKTVVSSKTAPETSSSSAVTVTSSLVDSPSPHSVAETGFANTNSSDLRLEVSGFADTDLLAVMDQFVGNTKSSNPDDSIIGLALGTALDGNGTPTTIAGMSEDSNSAFLASLLKPSNLELAAQTVQRIGSNTDDVHIEELNSGVAAGGVPVSMASPTLENILNPTGSTVQSPVSTTSDVFFSSAAPISSIGDSQSQQEALIGKESVPVSSLMLSPNVDNGLPSSFPPQWLNAESSNFSIGSLLDKLTTSPKKDERLVSLEESSPAANAFKEPSQDLLLSSHHLLDPETALHAFMDENSVDFVKKFQDLAKEMSGENKTPTSSSSGAVFPALSVTEANSRSSDESSNGSLNFKHILKQTNMNGC